MKNIRSGSISITIYHTPEENIGILHIVKVEYAREDNDLMWGSIVETNDQEWSDNNYKEIVEFANEELRSLGVYVR